MQFVLTETSKPFKQSGRPVVAILLVVFAHIVFWQLLRQPNNYLRHAATHAVVNYLQVLQIVPKPLMAKPPVEAAKTADPAVPAEKLAKKENTASKRPSVTRPASIQPMTETSPATSKSPEPLAIHEEPAASPGLNLDALRSSAVAMERKRKPTEIEQIQASHRQSDSLEKRLGEGTKRAEKKECLKAFSGLGVLAVIPLAVSTVVDTGCKW
ncbi:hypothetical protein ACO0LF_19565 [Undibacterium sp. Di27W]|uniref:hypothetical protein n=1 Tax=Undibacterium sp. Di27W TaxID=3413036 RepID=UPI003BF1B9C7